MYKAEEDSIVAATVEEVADIGVEEVLDFEDCFNIVASHCE